MAQSNKYDGERPKFSTINQFLHNGNGVVTSKDVVLGEVRQNSAVLFCFQKKKLLYKRFFSFQVTFLVNNTSGEMGMRTMIDARFVNLFNFL